MSSHETMKEKFFEGAGARSCSLKHEILGYLHLRGNFGRIDLRLNIFEAANS